MKARTPQPRLDTLRDRQERVLRVMVHARLRPDADLSLPALAKAAHLSEFHFQRVFSEVAGESPTAYVRHIRLNRAAFELRTSGATLPTIARRAGYTRVEPFLRAFKAHLGVTPGRFREANPASPDRVPASMRVWANRPGPDHQLRFTPLPAHSARGRSYPASRYQHLWQSRVAFLRIRDTHSPEDLQRLAAFAARRGPDDDLLFLTLNFDEPGLVPVRRQERHIAVVVGPRRRGEGDIGVQTVAGGSFAVGTTIAAVSRPEMSEATRWIRGTATRAGYAPRFGPIIHVYLDDPRHPPPRSGALIDILVPVQPPKSEMRMYWRRRRPVA
jgi:AraC family transcriptional regulator